MQRRIPRAQVMDRLNMGQLPQTISNPSATTLTPPRLLLLWLGATFLGAVLILSDLLQLDGLHLTQARLIIGRDFLNVWSGGNLALHGELATLYDYQAYMAWQASIFGPLDPYNYSYPPHSLFLAMPFAMLPYPLALALWTLLGATFFMWAARPYLPDTLSLAHAILTPAAIVNIWAGHYGFLIGGLWLLYFHYLDRFPGRSGAVAGLLTLKPHLGLLIALTMVSRRKLRPILIASAVALSLIGLSILMFGGDLWRTWLVETSALQTRIMTASGPKFYYFMMPSAYIALRAAPTALAFMTQAGFAVTALTLFWKARDARAQDLAFVSASATAVIMPYIFNYDLTVCSLGFAILLFGRWETLNTSEKVALWFAFAAPLLVMAFNPIGPIALLAGLFVQVRHTTGRNGQAIAPKFGWQRWQGRARAS
jgi:alpha-1,2-mannosyltransferase